MNKLSDNNNALLEIAGLKTYFEPRNGPAIYAVDEVDLCVAEREIVGLVGESGSGKTVLAHSILRLIPPPGRIVAGRILWRGNDLLNCSIKEMHRVRGREIAMIFQNPQASLNPVYPIGKQLRAVIQLHRSISKEAATAEVIRLLKLVHIADAATRLNDFPHQFSGGMCQRIMIAMALACQPSLLIADEPTSSLDVTIQAQIIDLLLEIREKFGMAILFISHDLGVVAQLCDRVAVMRRGKIVEEGSAVEIYGAPKHPYTQLLLHSVPIPDPNRRRNHQFLSKEILNLE